jgi:hypothetical protein
VRSILLNWRLCLARCDVRKVTRSMTSVGQGCMSNDEIEGRLAALEVFTMTAFGLYLANARNDPDYSKAGVLLDHTRAAVTSLATALPAEAQKAANDYADHLISVLQENLRSLRGEGGQSH